MHPSVSPSLRRLWRDDGVLQIGTEPGRSACVHGLDAPGSLLLDALDGRRDTLAVVKAASAAGVPAATAVRTLRSLATAGVLTDPGPPAGALRRRHVEVRGTGALALATGQALSTLGLGGLTLPRDPAGGVAPGPAPVDLVVVCGPADAPDGPHLCVDVGETVASVGPLVLPGRTACRGCLHQHRRDRDRGWPLVAAQLCWPPARADDADPVLVLAVAALAAAEVRDHLSGLVPASVEGTLELGDPRAGVRRRSWPPHPGCGCGASD